MRITVNGVATEVPSALTVAELVAQRVPEDARRIAVAVNAGVVPRSAWSTTELADGDSAELLTAVAGG